MISKKMVTFIIDQLSDDDNSDKLRIYLVQSLIRLLDPEERNFIYDNIFKLFILRDSKFQYLCDKVDSQKSFSPTEISVNTVKIKKCIKESIFLLSNIDEEGSNIKKGYKILPENTEEFNYVDEETFLKHSDEMIDLEIKNNFSFEFLLLSPAEQLWTFIYREVVYQFKKDDEIFNNYLIDLLYILNLPSTSIIQLDLIGRSKGFIKTLKFLQRLGVLIIISSDSSIIITNFKILFNKHTPDSDDSNKNKNYNIIIESNHKLYAYSNKKYIITILKLFSKVVSITKISETESFIRGLLDEDTLRETLKKDSSVDKSSIDLNSLIDYIKANGMIRPNLIDLIRLWDKDRIKVYKGVLLDGFLSHKEYIDTLKRLENEIIHRDDEKRVLFIKEKN